jgi:hypothetical protein
VGHGCKLACCTLCFSQRKRSPGEFAQQLEFFPSRRRIRTRTPDVTLALAAQELLAPLFADDPDSFIVDASAVFMQNAAQVVKCHDERAFLEGTEVGVFMSNFCVCVCVLLNEVSIPLCLACNTLLGQTFCGGARAPPPPRGA